MDRTNSSDYKMSVMSQDELNIAIQWAKQEGWNPGLQDATAFYAADPTGFLIGTLGSTPIATISAVKYGSSFGFIGLYIVKEEFRGQGYGLKLWQEAMQSLKGRNIGLDGVVAQQENYKKSGFNLAHRNIRFAGRSTQSPAPAAHIRSIKEVEFSHLEEYDHPFFPERRSAFLKHWVNQEHTHTLVILDGAKIVGYGCIRACVQGFKIGPLNAEHPDLALELFTALTHNLPEGSDIFLDIPEVNIQALDMAKKLGMSPSFETARMYTSAVPPMPLHKIFGITSFELG